MTMDAHSAHAGYRPDIDGLRAIAVLSVVIYHAVPRALPGGFIGVDVFFVISGFLITGLLLERLTQARFDIVDFYARRVRRIFPALLLVLVVSYALGWWLLLADEFRQLGGHIAGGAAFIANLVLWHEAGYFDNASATKPLLHLWSLGIEEQFYLLWPWLLWVAYGRRWSLPPVLAVLTLLSFIANVVNLERDAVATFYAPYTRCWELFAGALLAASPQLAQRLSAQRGVSALGLSLLIAGLCLINDTRPFPGYWALLPVLGTLLIIAAGARAWPNRVLLAARPMVATGLISYPFYLWHWPLLSLLRILGRQPPRAALALLVVIGAALLAWCTYRLLERPLRSAAHGSTVAAVLFAAMVWMGVLGYATFALDGLPSRAVVVASGNNAAALNWRLFHSEDCDRTWGGTMSFCLGYGKVDAPRVVILGDSTGNSLAPGLGAWIAAHGDGLVELGSHACPPVRGLLDRPGWTNGRNCIAGTVSAYQQVAATASVEWVVLAIYASDLRFLGIPGVANDAPLAQRFAVFSAMLDADIRFLRAAGKRVVVSYDMPSARTDARNCLPRPLSAWLTPSSSVCFAGEDSLYERQPYQQMFNAFFAERHDVCVFRQSELMMHNGELVFADAQGQLLLRDEHHLTVLGSTRMAALFATRCGADWYPAAAR